MERIWQVDMARGIALFMMLIFNWSYTLRFLDLINGGGWIYWTLFPHVIGFLFVFIAGVSLSLGSTNKDFIKKSIRRGLTIFGFGMLISLATWILYPESFIFFGVLHLIGLSILLSIPLVKHEKMMLAIGAFIILISMFAGSFITNRWIAWIGFGHIQTFDYFPLFPWLGVFLIGACLGKYLLNVEFSRNKPKIANMFIYPGRKTLLIYLLHQPVLLLILFLLRPFIN